MKRFVAALLLGLLTACAATRTADPPEASAPAEANTDRPGFWSDLGRVAGYAAVGAGAGAIIGLSALKGCQNESCLAGLIYASAFVPVGAVIGAGFGVVESIREHRKQDRAAALAATQPVTCLDARLTSVLRECSKDQGPVPTGDRASSADEVQSWFGACAAALERKWAAVRQSELPKPCLADSVPKGLEFECSRRSSLIERNLRLEQDGLNTLRQELQRGEPLRSCSAA